ncbi:MAG: UDP-N-acetylmuramoyl-L-alanyl-D-glutamate--2,6-diaminopimelate ligase [Gammaproteobacteria bacterium]
MQVAARDTGVTAGDLFGNTVPAELAGRHVPDITLDSRRVTPGCLFLAVAGGRAHGLSHVAEAADAGAGMVAWEPADGLAAPRLPEGVVAFPVPGLKRQAGELADRFFGEPSRRVRVTGITGTNGKTTCSHLVAGGLQRLGTPAGIIGTLGVGMEGELAPSLLTTPDVVEVHRSLSRLADRGARAVAMEVSSHALAQGRVDAVRFAVAAFTNLSRDHLDYHGSLEAYAEAKASLFLAHDPAGAVINVGDPVGRRIWERLPDGMGRIAVGREADRAAGNDSALVLGSVRTRPAGLVVSVEWRGSVLTLRSPLVGEFNAENLALALAVLISLDYDPRAAAEALSTVAAPPGRMEAFTDGERGVLCVVDYAHTPDALGKALAALREHCEGRLWCVFGCGGDRDPGKRPEMARIAERMADELVVTDDNPRTEDGHAIVADILAGLADPRRAVVERDREKAIRQTIEAAAPGDVVLVAGKGHEDYQIIGRSRRPFSDRDIVRSLVETAA